MGRGGVVWGEGVWYGERGCGVGRGGVVWGEGCGVVPAFNGDLLCPGGRGCCVDTMQHSMEAYILLGRLLVELHGMAGGGEGLREALLPPLPLLQLGAEACHLRLQLRHTMVAL